MATEEEKDLTTDELMQQLGSCGRFQIVLILVQILAVIPPLFVFLNDGFGIYNPGWRCIDHVNANMTPAAYHSSSNVSMPIISNTSLVASTATNGSDNVLDPVSKLPLSVYGRHSCPAFESCHLVEFSPDANTLITEWSMLCNRGWMLSTLISVGMAGNAAATPFVGFIGDRYGRKVPLLVSKIGLVVFSVLSALSVNWLMYTICAFLLGFSLGFSILSRVLLFEYVREDWRIKMNSIPDWSVIGILFALTAMVTHDWRTIRWISVVMGVIFSLPLIWMPRSLRWLIVRGRKEDAGNVMNFIAKWNKTEVPDSYRIKTLHKQYNDEENESSKKKNMSKTVTILDLFTKKGYRIQTMAYGFMCLAIDLLYFAFSFTIISLPGNVYVNMIISNLTELPANVISFFLANRFKRKPSSFALFGSSTLCLAAMLTLDLSADGDIKKYGAITLVMLSKLLLYIGWIILSTSMSEFYPTVARSTINSYIMLASAAGGFFAPYLIPSDPSTFYVTYAILLVFSTLSTSLIYLIPETKGKPLKDDWYDNVDNNDDDAIKRKSFGHHDNDDGIDDKDDNSDDLEKMEARNDDDSVVTDKFLVKGNQRRGKNMIV